jgi:DNA polymerase III delta prime subunit
MNSPTQPACQPSLSETDLSIINDIYERAHAEHRSPVSMMKDLLLWYKNADRGWSDLQKILTPAGQSTEVRVEQRHIELVRQIEERPDKPQRELAQLLANSEARAVDSATKQLRAQLVAQQKLSNDFYSKICELCAQLAQARKDGALRFSVKTGTSLTPHAAMSQQPGGK